MQHDPKRNLSHRFIDANIGKMIKDVFRQADEENNPLVSAGAAAGLASAFNAPLTGLMLAVEMTSNFELLLPLIFTSLTASLLTTLLGNQPVYTTLLKRTLAKATKDDKQQVQNKYLQSGLKQ